MLAHIIKQDNVIIILNGKSYNIEKTDNRYEEIINLIKARDEDGLTKMFDRTIEVVDWCNKFINSDYILKFDNNLIIKSRFDSDLKWEVDARMCEKIKQMINEGFDALPLVNFVIKLSSNPSFRVVNELYDFLQNNSLPLTDDGCFLAYKRVDQDYTDYHSHKFDNHIGKACSMPRNKVDDNSENTCSSGLHFCSLDYLSSFRGCRIMIVKIDPRDVVSIPVDYNNTKGRCCKYEVIDEVPENDVKNLQEKYERSILWMDGADETSEEDEDEEVCSDMSNIDIGDDVILTNGAIATCVDVDYAYEYSYKIVEKDSHKVYFFNEVAEEKFNKLGIKLQDCK